MYVQIIYCYKPTNPNLNDIKQNFIRLIDFASQEFSQSSTSQHLRLLFISVQFSSITQSCPTLCDPMNRSMPGLPVHDQLPESTQTHQSVMPSNHLILCHSLLLLPLIFSSTGVFSNESVLPIRWPKYWSFSISPSDEYSGLISFRNDWFDLLAVQGTLKSSPTPQFKSINSLALSLLDGPALTSIHDYWKNHSFDYVDLCKQTAVSAF